LLGVRDDEAVLVSVELIVFVRDGDCVIVLDGVRVLDGVQDAVIVGVFVAVLEDVSV